MRPVTHWMPYAWNRSLHKKQEVKRAERLARKIESVVIRKRWNWPLIAALVTLLALALWWLL